MKNAFFVFLFSCCAAMPPITASSNNSTPRPCNTPGVELGDVDAASVSLAAGKRRNHFSHGDKTLYLRINSHGGEVFSGLTFIQDVEELKKQGARLVCIVDTKAISMGFVILQAVCDVRLTTPRAIFLAHNGSLRGGGGNVEAIGEELAMLTAINNTMAKICADRIGMPLADYKAKLKGHSWIMDPDEALAAHVVDGIVQPMDTPRMDES